MQRRCPHPGVSSVLGLAVSVVFVALPAGSQAPPSEPGFENLQVLPPDIGRPALMDVMRFDLVGGLGVRCSTCHVGEEGRPLSEYDFPADDKPMKRKAREMMRMTRAINEELLAGLEARLDPPVQVNCITCHRGQPQPRMIQEVLHREVVENGLDAAVARYRELREEYFGSHTYDFSPTALTALARTLAAEGRSTGAVRFLELNVEMHPGYWYSHILLAELLTEESPERARREQERALGLAPDDAVEFVRRRLARFAAQLEAGSAEPSGD